QHSETRAHAYQRTKTSLTSVEKTKRVQNQRENEPHDHSYATTDDGIKQRLTEAALGLHRFESEIRLGKHHGQGLDERADKAALLPVLPRQAGAARDNCGRRSCARLHRRDSRRSGSCELWELREGLPTGHALTPADIGWRKAASAQPLANFFFGENAQTRCAAVDMNHRHNALV